MDDNDRNPRVRRNRADYIGAGLQAAGRATKANDREIIAAPCGIHLSIMTVPGATMVRAGYKRSLLPGSKRLNDDPKNRYANRKIKASIVHGLPEYPIPLLNILPGADGNVSILPAMPASWPPGIEALHIHHLQ